MRRTDASQRRQARERARRAKTVERERKQQEKADHRFQIEIRKSLSMDTIKEFKLGRPEEVRVDCVSKEPNKIKLIELLLEHVDQSHAEVGAFQGRWTDEFLYGGDYNSVIGVAGFRYFKTRLLEVVEGEKGDLGPVFKAESTVLRDLVFRSGIYPESGDEESSSELLTRFRRILKDSPSLTHEEFEALVVSFKTQPGSPQVLLTSVKIAAGAEIRNGAIRSHASGQKSVREIFVVSTELILSRTGHPEKKLGV